MTKTARIRIALTVEVDIETWAEEYGVDPGEVRRDVQLYVRNALAQAPVPMLAVK